MDSLSMDTSESNLMTSNLSGKKSDTPAWRKPISTSFSASLRERMSSASPSSPEALNANAHNDADTLYRTSSQENEQYSRKDSRNDESDCSNNDNQNNVMSHENKPAVSNNGNKPDVKEEDSQTVIQILLPCIICNRTFSPEALERHSKVCTKVNIKSPFKPVRGTFDISEKRKKGTKLEDFIPPPPTFDALTDNRFGFSRGSRSRTSLRGTSCTTRSTLASPGTRLERSVSQNRERERSVSTSRTPTTPVAPPSVNSQTEFPFDDTSEFGSNNSEENAPHNLPSYAKPIAPTDMCPYCNRSFGIKSYDRHVEFCKEIYERKKYEIQPIPKEKEEALERQEIRTKYRPMKSSSSMSSLRSMSPAKDFASMAMKLFGGLRRTEGSSNLYFNQIKNNLKKSNESIANSCYGDYTRGLRRPSPSPARQAVTASAANKLNNLLTKSFLHQQQQNQYAYPTHQGSLLPMRINTSSNIPKMTKSSDNLIAGNNYGHVQSSGYGQSPSVHMMNSNNSSFSRNSRSRSSLHKNFFRTKRAEPDGTENTATLSPTSTSPLIISPVNFYSKGNKTSSSALDLSERNNRTASSGSELQSMMILTENARPTGGSLLACDPDYDPYEKAAKQLEELLKTTPVKSSKRTTRRTGLEKAFESVGVPSDLPAISKQKLGRAQSLDYQADPFGLNITSSRGRQAADPFGLGGMAMTPNIDDSYWDQILRKGDNQHIHSNDNNNNPETVSSQEESDTSGASDTAKSRAMSNTSSADSAFSRSEVNDSEFEVLESIAGLGDANSNRFKKPQQREERSKSIDFFGPSSKAFEPHHRSAPRSPSVDHGRIPMDISPVPESRPKVENSSLASATSGGGGGGTWAKFCHECGTPYPTILAKFCSECGEKRVCKG